MPLRFSLTIPRATSAVEPSRAAVLHEPTVRGAERDVYLRLTLGRGAIIGGAIYLYRHSF